MKRLPLLIVCAALLVSAPRLAIAFVMADGVTLSATVAAWVFTATGVASGIVLTGGNVYLATALAEHWQRRGGLWAVLLAAWTLFLAFAVALIAPVLAYGLSHSVLREVLPTSAARWAWSVIAALSVEVLAAAAMAASVLSAAPSKPSAEPKRTSAIRAALSERIVRTLEADTAPSITPDAVSGVLDMPMPTAWERPAAHDAPIAPHEAPRSGYTCPLCNRVFASKNALSAHGRFCKQA